MKAIAKLLAAAALATLAGPAAAQTVTVALNADIRSINPGVNRDDNTDRVVLHMVEGLVGYREDGSVGPLLAESVGLSADGRAYTFRLRAGVRFHTGAEMTSAEVLWSWKRYMDPKTEWRCQQAFDGQAGFKVADVAAPDARTVVMTLNQPSALFLHALASTDCAMVGILHPASLNADGSFNQPIGTGPYRFAEWKRGQYVTLARFEDYAALPGDRADGYVGAKRPLIKEVRFLVVPDAAATKAGLLSGRLDVVDVPDTDIPELQKNPAITVQTAPTAVKHTFLFQTRDAVVGDVRLRRAIAAALDLPQLVAAVSNGLAEPNGSAIHTTSGYYGEAQKRNHVHDPAAARKLLQEAGYKGEKIKLMANRRSIMPSFPAALIAQNMLQGVGINTEIEVLEWATQLDRYLKGSFQMMSFSYSARLDPAMSYEQFTGPKDRQPRKVWDNPEVQGLLERAMTISAEDERRRIFDDLHARQLAEVPLIILFNGVDSAATTKRVKGFRPWVASKPRLWEVRLD